jgi:hypothetical protein
LFLKLLIWNVVIARLKPSIARRARMALIATRDCSLDVRMLSASGNPRLSNFAELIGCLFQHEGLSPLDEK